MGSRVTSLIVIASVGLLAGCSASQVASPAPSASTSPSTAVASASPSTAPTASPSPTASPTPAPSASAEPAVGRAPAGPWTGLAWIHDEGAFPKLIDRSSEIAQLQVFGWSDGYVAFGSDGGQGTNRRPTLVSSTSSDGLHWSPGKKVDLAGATDQVTIERVAEGPEGLLAVGYFPADTCGGPPSIAGLWRSTDWTTWRHVALPRDMARGHVEDVDGGSAGYIATGKQRDGTTPGVWLSPDGATWKAATLPKPPSGTLVINDGTSFKGGLVLAGAVVGPEGCGGASSIHPAVWWSADGAAWTREQLPGGLTSKDASLTIHRISDDEVLAIDNGGETPKAWVSSDGRTWTAVPTPSDEALYGTIGSGGHSISVMAPDESGPLTFKSVGDQLDVTVLPQTGDGPTQVPDGPGQLTAVGPTGVLVVNTDQSGLWLGVPSAS